MVKILLSSLIVSIFITSVLKSNAQNNIYYDTCHSLRQLEGEWMSVNGFDTIKIYLRVNNFYSIPNNTITGELLGWHEYKIGNSIIESDYSHRFDVLPTNFSQKGAIVFSLNIVASTGNSECSTVLTMLHGSMRDLNKKNKYQILKITRISENVIQVHQLRGEAFVTADNPYIPGYTLPQTFVLTNQ